MKIELAYLGKVSLAFALATIILTIVVIMANAADYPTNLWKGLIAEAVSEGERGMEAVCFVYRTRLQNGLNLGCVALLKRHDLDAFVARQGKKYEVFAKAIVERVFNGQVNDPTFGATHYENIKAFGIPYWAKEMVVTCKIGVHTFYKEK